MKYRGRTEIVSNILDSANRRATKTKSSEYHKELTDAGKCVGCSLSPEVCTCRTASEYDTTGANEEAEPLN